MIKRCPHFTVDAAGVAQDTHTNAYKNDNLKLWNLMSALTRDRNDAWTYVKAGKPSKDGRLAYTSLKAHFLGQNYQQAQQALHENRLRNTTYSGEQRKMNFDKYSTILFDSIQALNAMKADGYQGVDERSAVRYLLDGIQDTSLDATKNTIMADNAMRSDFQACVQLFQDFLLQKGARIMLSKGDSKKVGAVGVYTTDDDK